MKFNKNEEVYYACRSGKVIKCIISKDIKTNPDSLSSDVLVYHSGYKHEVYVNQNDLYFNKKSAIRKISLVNSINKLRTYDLASKLTKDIFKK